MAETMASKSPVAVQNSKIALLYARDHSVTDGLDQIVRTSPKSSTHFFLLVHNGVFPLNSTPKDTDVVVLKFLGENFYAIFFSFA